MEDLRIAKCGHQVKQFDEHDHCHSCRSSIKMYEQCHFKGTRCSLCQGWAKKQFGPFRHTNTNTSNSPTGPPVQPTNTGLEIFTRVTVTENSSDFSFVGSTPLIVTSAPQGRLEDGCEVTYKTSHSNSKSENLANLPGQYGPAGPSSSIPTSNGFGVEVDGQAGYHIDQGNPGLNLSSDTLLPGTSARSYPGNVQGAGVAGMGSGPGPQGSNLGLSDVAVPGITSQAHLNVFPGASCVGMVPGQGLTSNPGSRPFTRPPIGSTLLPTSGMQVIYPYGGSGNGTLAGSTTHSVPLCAVSSGNGGGGGVAQLPSGNAVAASQQVHPGIQQYPAGMVPFLGMGQFHSSPHLTGYPMGYLPYGYNPFGMVTGRPSAPQQVVQQELPEQLPSMQPSLNHHSFIREDGGRSYP